MKKWRKQYFEQKYNARGRGILFVLTFNDWLTIWQESGHLHERGKGRGQYVMARYLDLGPYSIPNVRIITCGENLAEAQISAAKIRRTPRPGQGSRRSHCCQP